MKNSNNQKNRIRISSIFLCMFSYSIIQLFSYSCTRLYDNIDKFVDGEIVYIDKLDDIIRVRYGFERVEIDLLRAGRIPASQIRMAKATKTVIECEDFDEPDHRRVIDSICSWVNVTGLTQLKYYDLVIYTEDEHGDRSLPLKTSVRPYTTENLNAIEIIQPTITASASAAQIEWMEGMSAETHQVISYRWQYTDRGGSVVTGEDEGDSPVIFLENVKADTNIPVTLTCRIIPRYFISGSAYTPILDVIDYQVSFNIKLSSEAGEVIFLKMPESNMDADLSKDLPVTFAWTKVTNVNAYTLKFSLLPNFAPSETYTVNAGNVNSYVMTKNQLLEAFNSFSLSTADVCDVYWTVAPSTQGVSVKTSYRPIKLWTTGVYVEYDPSKWDGVSCSSFSPDKPVHNAFDRNVSTGWYSNFPIDLPQWVIIDLKTRVNIYKFGIHRGFDPNGVDWCGDTKTVELSIGDSPDVYGSWTKIGELVFPNADNSGGSNSVVLMEAYTTNNTTEGRYIKLVLPDNYRAAPKGIVHVYEVYLYHLKD